MDLSNLKNSIENLNSPGEVISVKQYFAIIGVLMIVVILGINFFVNFKGNVNDKKKETNTLSEFPSATPKQEVAGSQVGPQAQVGPIGKEISTPTKSPTLAPTAAPTSAPTATNTPAPTSAPTSTPTNTPTPTLTETPTPTPSETPTPTP